MAQRKPLPHEIELGTPELASLHETLNMLTEARIKECGQFSAISREESIIIQKISVIEATLKENHPYTPHDAKAHAASHESAAAPAKKALQFCDDTQGEVATAILKEIEQYKKKKLVDKMFSSFYAVPNENDKQIVALREANIQYVKSELLSVLKDMIEKPKPNASLKETIDTWKATTTQFSKDEKQLQKYTAYDIVQLPTGVAATLFKTDPGIQRRLDKLFDKVAPKPATAPKTGK